MDKKEAARILDPETSRDALWEYEEEDRLEACDEACRVAAAVLRAEPPKLDRNRWMGCKSCRGKQSFSTRYRLHYCPVCGKPQSEKEWAELERRLEVL